MAAELQSLAQSLATRLQRPVAIDDTGMRLLAHTPHDGPVDDARLESILRLQPPAEVVNWVLARGIAKAPGAVRVPGRAEWKLHPRVCAPIRCQGLLLGYVWLIDADESLTDAELALVEETAAAAGPVMYRDRLLDDVQRSRRRELLRDLLGTDPVVRSAAAEALVADEHFVSDTRVQVVAVHVTPGEGAQVTLPIEAALDRAAGQFPPATCLFLARGNTGVLVCAATAGVDVREVAASIRTDITGHVAGDVVVAIGKAVDGLADTIESHERAMHAVAVARTVPGQGPVTAWDDLGVYQLLVQLPLDRLGPDVIPAGLLRLLDDDSADQLVETLESYLDNAGDVRTTVDQLAIHRTSLYYRLSRVEALTGLRLSDGTERLAVHLGLKLARLIGRHPACR